MGQEGKSPGYLDCMQKRDESYSSSSTLLLSVCVCGQGRLGLGDFGCLWACKVMQNWSSSLCCLGTSGSRTTGTARGGCRQVRHPHSYGGIAFWNRVLASAVYSFPKPSLESGCWGLNKDTKVKTCDVRRELEISSLLRLCHEYGHFYRDLPGGGSGSWGKIHTCLHTLAHPILHPCPSGFSVFGACKGWMSQIHTNGNTYKWSHALEFNSNWHTPVLEGMRDLGHYSSSF